jgi:methylated-DNA-protein-cysteine methyltransferase-like protein
MTRRPYTAPSARSARSAAAAASTGAPFREAVLAVVGRIPKGRVCTYGDVARLAGRPGAARAVGRLMAEGRNGALPYHRVVGAGGALGGYGGAPAFKAALLNGEGVIVCGQRITGFRHCRWPPR